MTNTFFLNVNIEVCQLYTLAIWAIFKAYFFEQYLRIFFSKCAHFYKPSFRGVRVFFTQGLRKNAQFAHKMWDFVVNKNEYVGVAHSSSVSGLNGNIVSQTYIINIFLRTISNIKM